MTCRGNTVLGALLSGKELGRGSRHDLGIEVYEQHTKGYREQKQRLILLFDREIEQDY